MALLKGVLDPLKCESCAAKVKELIGYLNDGKLKLYLDISVDDKGRLHLNEVEAITE
uniref:Uncharacterized protein n=1 Tax=viral metagenome TaxID=1070528 RepID=A0A6M3KJT1_9ZZZZ